MRLGICDHCFSVVPVDDDNRLRGHRVPGQSKTERCLGEGFFAEVTSNSHPELKRIAEELRTDHEAHEEMRESFLLRGYDPMGLFGGFCEEDDLESDWDFDEFGVSF